MTKNRRTAEQRNRRNQLERERYARNGGAAREARRNIESKLRAERIQLTNQIKLGSGCIDCGFRGHPAALHFDHRDPATKSFTISKSLCFSLDKLLAEIAKCDVRCANCHAIRGYREGHLGRPRIGLPSIRSIQPDPTLFDGVAS